MDTIGWGGVPLLATSLFLIVFGLWSARRARAIEEEARHWPTTNATITKSRLWSYRGSYSARVSYTYEIAGQQFVGKKVRPGIASSGRRSAAQALLDRFPVGAHVAARYDPERPKRAYLDPTAAVQGTKALVVTGSIIAVIGAGLIAVGLLRLFPDGGRRLAGDEHDWGHRHSGSGVDIYYDASTVQGWLDGTHMVERINYGTPRESGESFLVSETVYDCAGHRVRMIHGVFYDAQGARIGEEDWPDDPFEPNPAGSIGGEIEREICR